MKKYKKNGQSLGLKKMLEGIEKDKMGVTI